jgi:2-iminobutanoate/2-iminopropanoate deaminase
MSREVISTPGAPGQAAGIGSFSYSQAIRAAGLIFVSGQGPFDAATGAIAGSSIQEQTRQCLTNIAAILEAGGSSMEQVVSVTFILRRPEDFAGMNEEWARWFPVDPPARQGAKHPLEVGDALISIAAIAAS